MKFATDTSVSVAKTRGEIEDLVTRAGARRFMSGAEEGRAFEEAFLAQLVVKDDDGRAVRFGPQAVKAIAASHERNGPPQLLLGSEA